MAAFIWIFIKLPQEWWIHIAQLDFTDFMKEDVFGVAVDTSWGDAIGENLWFLALFWSGHCPRCGHAVGVAHGTSPRLEPRCRRRSTPGEHAGRRHAGTRRPRRVGSGRKGRAGGADLDHLRPGTPEHRRHTIADDDRGGRTRGLERCRQPVARPQRPLVGDDGIAVRRHGRRQRRTRRRLHRVSPTLGRTDRRRRAIFFVLLLTLIITLYDRYRPLRAARYPLGTCNRRRRDRRVTSRWVGHATTVVDVGGFRVLTDPLLRRRVAHLRRRWPVPDPPDIDLVLISHVHVDHLHLPSLRLIGDDVPIVAPAGTRRCFGVRAFAASSSWSRLKRSRSDERRSWRPTLVIRQVAALTVGWTPDHSATWSTSTGIAPTSPATQICSTT